MEIQEYKRWDWQMIFAKHKTGRACKVQEYSEKDAHRAWDTEAREAQVRHEKHLEPTIYQTFYTQYESTLKPPWEFES